MDFLVDLPTVDPDLSAATSQRTNACHLHHGAGEVAEELGRVRGVGADLRLHRPSSIHEQLLVRVQEPSLPHQIGVVVIVEHGRRRRVERRQLVVAARARAVRP